MLLGEAIKEMIHQARMTQKKLAAAAGYKTVSSITTPIAKNEIKVNTLVRLANAAGYDLVLRKLDNPEEFAPIRIDEN